MENTHAPHKTTDERRIHWFGLASMSAALIAGLGFALGQHFFYVSLHGRKVPEGSYGMAEFDSGVSKQQVNTAIGTALAFAVKSCLVLAVSTAYVQLFWKALAKQPTDRPFDLHNIDKAYSALRNATLLVNFPGWRRFPLLFILALATWLIPMASIISPATLSIESRLQLPPPTSARYAPTINFNTLSYLAPSIIMPWGYYSWSGPSQALTRLVTAVAAQGAILPIDPPSANATWRAEFRGPVLRCQSLSADEMSNVRRNIEEFILARPPWGSDAEEWEAYMLWYGDSSTASLPYTSEPLVADSRPMPQRRILDSKSTDYQGIQTTFRVAVFAQANSMYSQTLGSEYLGYTDRKKWFGDLIETQYVTALQCKLFDSSYRTLIEYTNGNQTVTVDASRTEDDEEFGLPLDLLTGPRNASCPGFHSGTLDDLVDASVELKDLADACYFDPKLTSRIAYQTMFEAFSQAISGPITLQPWKSGNVIKTKLMEAAEIYGSSDDAIINNQMNDKWLQKSLLEFGRADIAGYSMHASDRNLMPLSLTLEQMFQNFTISLMSSLAFQPNLSDTTNLPLTQVTSETYHNVYRYAMIRLWTAYGLAIACAAAAVALGVHTIVTSGSSYSNEFSTIVRVSRHAHLGHEVDSCDASGRDPLPKYLKRTTFKLSRESDVESTDLDVKKVTPPASYQPIPHTEQDSSHASTW